MEYGDEVIECDFDVIVRYLNEVICIIEIGDKMEEEWESVFGGYKIKWKEFVFWS